MLDLQAAFQPIQELEYDVGHHQSSKPEGKCQIDRQPFRSSFPEQQTTERLVLHEKICLQKRAQGEATFVW